MESELTDELRKLLLIILITCLTTLMIITLCFRCILTLRKRLTLCSMIFYWINCNFIESEACLMSGFKSYLSGRKQYVHVNGVKSDTLNITHSVPQGSNLGPLLFLVQINDLPLCSDYFNYTMFADDCTLSVKFPRMLSQIFILF